MRTRHVLAALVALGLVLAGCGGDDSPEGTVSGTGYTFKLAPGWTDATKRAKRSIIRFDVVVGKKGTRFATNVNILRVEVPKATTLDDARHVYRRQLESLGVTRITGTRAAAIDGDDAFTYEYDQRTAADDAVHGRQVVVLHDGHIDTITLSALNARFDAANQEFSTMMRSWQWK
jgi:hypothetical protein